MFRCRQRWMRQEKIWYPNLLDIENIYTILISDLLISILELHSNKNVFTLQWKMWYFFSVMETEPTSVNNVVLFSVMETDYSTTLIIVCSETSLQQKRLHTSVNNVVLFSVMETEPTSVNNVVLFFSYGDRLLNPFNYCMQWNLNPTKTSSHFSEQCGTFFQLWRQIPLQWTMWYFLSVTETDYSTHLIIVCSKNQTNKNVFTL